MTIATMTLGPLTVTRVKPNPLYRDVQCVYFEGCTEFYLSMPPIEHTITPGDRFAVEYETSAPDGPHPDYLDEIAAVRINDGPRMNMPRLWEQHWQTHPRLWLGER